MLTFPEALSAVWSMTLSNFAGCRLRGTTQCGGGEGTRILRQHTSTGRHQRRRVRATGVQVKIDLFPLFLYLSSYLSQVGRGLWCIMRSFFFSLFPSSYQVGRDQSFTLIQVWLKICFLLLCFFSALYQPLPGTNEKVVNPHSFDWHLVHLWSC